MIAQILVVAACVAIATRAGHPALVPQLLVEGGLAAAAGVAVFAGLRMGRWRGLAPHLQVRALACAAVAMAARQLTIPQTTVALPAAPFPPACFIRAAGGTNATAAVMGKRR